MEANILVGDNQEILDGADAMLASLTNIAYSNVPEEAVEVITKRKYKSRFFFTLSKSFADLAESNRQVFKPKELTHIDHEVEKRLKDYKKKMPSELASNIDRVREFFLNEIAPITLAANAGASQAREVVKRLVNSDVDGTQFEKFERLTAKAVDIKMARFIAREFSMTKAEATEMLNELKPRSPQILPIGIPGAANGQRTDERRESESRTDRKEKERNQKA